ncbi:MAG: tRNA lysidine(34) synthetase TilS [Acidiferrobacterales bacterium]|nr:tRNA lysidine(34) synthetase TilS [Acidiferrobacterales bacterium]
MIYCTDQFQEHLFANLAQDPDAEYFVAFSGGKDSTVLLHLMSELQKRHQFSLTALHVNHNINVASMDWANHCQQVCNTLDVSFEQISLKLTDTSEKTARFARYEWFRDQISPNSILMTAHHSQDRVETLMFNLMRGSGSRGLSSLRAVTPFHGAKLVRPMLAMSQQQIDDYATRHKLSWVEDPSNQECHYSRNRIRHQVLPVLTDFRADALQGILRAASNLEKENELLREIAISDLVEVREHPKHPLDHSYAICFEDFAHLSRTRQSNLLRFWLQSLKLHIPSQRLLEDLLTAFASSPNATMVLQESGNQFRFYQGYMYVMPALEETTPVPSIDWRNINQPIELYHRKVRLDATSKLRDLIQKRTSSTVRLSARPHVSNPKALQGHSLNLKKWLQEVGVPPWRRQTVPLLTIRQPNSDLVLSPVDQQLQSDWVSLSCAV